MTDQQRFDTIAILGNDRIYTPNLDRLAKSGAAFSNAYSTCPVCMPARYTLMSGCEPPTTGVWKNDVVHSDMHHAIEQRCGPFLPRALQELGYRTFGVGKFHTFPWDAPLGFETQLHSEELYCDAEQRSRDAYASFIVREHPEFAWIDALMGERTEMYYMPQMSPLPAELTVEAWAADQAAALIRAGDDRPWFGFVSFIGPHPPFAPPQPYNLLYDPDRLPGPIRGDISVDHRDQQIPLMNRLIWADDISSNHSRVLKARYYGEITYIDSCLGRLLAVVDDCGYGDNTVICFFSDHGEHLGDHRAWQKESYFEASTRVPFLVSWPGHILPGERRELVCLTDLFGLATSAAGRPEYRQGIDLLGLLSGGHSTRETLFGYYGHPGQGEFKLMTRHGTWKQIYFANGGQTQLFDLHADPHELNDLSGTRTDINAGLVARGAEQLARLGCVEALDGTRLRAVPFADWRTQLERLRADWPTGRVFQFGTRTGIARFPDHPRDVLDRK